MLLDIPFSMNTVINGQLALNLDDICLDNTLQLLCKSLQKFGGLAIHKNRQNLTCKSLNVYTILQNTRRR